MSEEGTLFLRAFVDHGSVFVETQLGVLYYLPNGQHGRPAYDAKGVYERVRAVGRINLEHWSKLT